MSLRAERLASEIKRVLSPEISNLAQTNKLGLASVSKVQLSKDFRIANIFVNLLIIGDNTIDNLLAILNSNKGELRHIVSQSVHIRHTPELRFYYDDTLEAMAQVDKLLDKVKTEFPYKNNYGDENVYDFKNLDLEDK